jgi:hypothetical protein
LRENEERKNKVRSEGKVGVRKIVVIVKKKDDEKWRNKKK